MFAAEVSNGRLEGVGGSMNGPLLKVDPVPLLEEATGQTE
jgi:hypothetical protein